MTARTPKYGKIVKVIAPSRSMLDFDMWRGAFCNGQKAQSR
jgi:hypothetical protein